MEAAGRRLVSGGPRLAVIGAGAFGCLLAARLHEGGVDVTLVARRTEQVENLLHEGLTLHDGERLVTLRVPCVRAGASLVDFDFAVFCMKAYDTADAAAMARVALGPNVAVMTLQNGAGNLETLVDVFGRRRVLAGISTEGAFRISDTAVRHTGRGETHIGEAAGGQTARLDLLASLLRAGGFSITTADAVEPLIWRKLVISAGINALTSILDVSNGFLWDDPAARVIMEEATGEAVAVANATGLNFTPAEMIERARSVARQTAQNRSSMATDLGAGRRTEIDSIQGYLIAQAGRGNVPVPVNRMLFQLVRALEHRKKTA